MIADKNEIIYSLEKYVNELEEVINKSIKDNNSKPEEVYSSLGTTLLWIGSCLDRLREVKVEFNEEEKNYVQAFRGAYDAQKHSVLLIKFQKYNKGGFTFPISFPLVIPAPNYYFKELEDGIINNEKEIRKYNKILGNKPIMLEISKIKEIIISKISKC